MKILVLGVDGMIGHKIYQSLSSEKFDIIATSKKESNKLPIDFSKAKFIQYNFNGNNINELINLHNPDIIINCIGATTRRFGSIDVKEIFKTNSHLPLKLSQWAKKNQKWLIHFSTDCVFSGLKGNYKEESVKDADDLYGISKSKGEEIELSNSLIIRCSMIGREIFNNTELLEWFISRNNANADGYTKAIYSGVTTLWMSTLIKKLIIKNIKLNGLYNISSSAITKFELLSMIKAVFKLNIEIFENGKLKSNKSLNSEKFKNDTGIIIPSWNEMLKDLYTDAIQNKNIYLKK
jgi:dTDP-4-dehydrorhamnose reductase